MLKVFDKLLQLLKEDPALAFSPLGSASGGMVDPVENDTLPSHQRLGWARRESTGRWPELSTTQPQVGWWRRRVLQRAPGDLSLGVHPCPKQPSCSASPALQSSPSLKWDGALIKIGSLYGERPATKEGDD